ncbi:MAG: exosortase/archaeosortase family protein [Bryobacteraceae bacterium]
MPRRLRTQTLGYLLLLVISLLLFREPLSRLVTLSWNDEHYNHIVLMPFISLGLIFLQRAKTFLHTQYCPRVGIPVIAVATALAYLFGVGTPPVGPQVALALAVALVALIWIAGFVLFYGTRAFAAAVFPLFLVLLIVPIPPPLVQLAEIALQKASGEATGILFYLTGTPVFREGLHFSLPGVTIEVAQECSGIRSSIALLITGLVLSHLFLQSGWRKTLLIVLTIPIAILKNALRIAILSWLAVYVSKDFLFGDLHHRGGPVFSLLSLALLVPLLMALKKSEARCAKALILDSGAPLPTSSARPATETVSTD